MPEQITFDAFDGGEEESTDDNDDGVNVHVSTLRNDLAFIGDAKSVGVTAEPSYPHSEYRRVWDN